MPLWIVDITKQVGSVLYEWGNRYLVNAADLTDASSVVSIIAGAEAGWHSDLVSFTQGRVASATPFDGLYNTVPLALTGALVTSGQPMPAITTINVEVRIAGFGRPGRKFYHPFLDPAGGMSTVAPFQWLATYVSDVKDAVETMISNCSVNGTPIVRDLDHEWLELAVVRKVFGYHQFNKASPSPPE